MKSICISSLSFHFENCVTAIEYDADKLHLENQQGRKGVDIVYICDSNVLYFIEVKDFTTITSPPRSENLWFSHIHTKTTDSRNAIATADLSKYSNFAPHKNHIHNNEQECCVAHAEINRNSHSYLFPKDYHSIILQSMKNKLIPFFPTMQFYAVDCEILSRLSLPWTVTSLP